MQEVERYVSDNQRLLHAVYMLYADPLEDGAVINLEQFRSGRLHSAGLHEGVALVNGWRGPLLFPLVSPVFVSGPYEPKHLSKGCSLQQYSSLTGY